MFSFRMTLVTDGRARCLAQGWLMSLQVIKLMANDEKLPPPGEVVNYTRLDVIIIGVINQNYPLSFTTKQNSDALWWQFMSMF